MRRSRLETQYRRAQGGLFIALGFVAFGLVVAFLFPAIGTYAWIVVGVSAFTCVGELVTMAHCKREMNR